MALILDGKVSTVLSHFSTLLIGANLTKLKLPQSLHKDPAA